MINNVTDDDVQHALAVETFRDIVKEMKSFENKIPCINRITTFNDKEVIINFFDKFFTVYEVITYKVDEIETSNLAAVALGRHKGKGEITLIDFRYIGKGEVELFKEGIDAFLTMVDNNKMEELPPTELHEGGTMSYDAIIQKIATTYSLVKPVIIH